MEESFYNTTSFIKSVDLPSTSFVFNSLPEINNNNMLALSFNPNIPHHESLPQYQMNDVLVFEEVTQQNIHLCQNKTGLFTAAHEIMIGKFKMKDEKMALVLNDFKREAFDFNLSERFWKLSALYQHVM